MEWYLIELQGRVSPSRYDFFFLKEFWLGYHGSRQTSIPGEVIVPVPEKAGHSRTGQLKLEMIGSRYENTSYRIPTSIYTGEPTSFHVIRDLV